jgi:hypothetical protein
MRKVLGFLLVLVSAALVFLESLGVAGKYLSGKIHAADIPRTLGGVMVAAVLVVLLHKLAAKLTNVKWTRYVPYLIFLAIGLLFSLLGLREYVYASAVLAVFAIACWKLPSAASVAEPTIPVTAAPGPVAAPGLVPPLAEGRPTGDYVKRAKLGLGMIGFGLATIYAVFYAYAGGVDQAWAKMPMRDHGAIVVGICLIGWGTGALINFAVMHSRVKNHAA